MSLPSCIKPFQPKKKYFTSGVCTSRLIFFYRHTLTHTHARARMYFYAHLTENMTMQFKFRLALIKCNLSLTTMSAKSSKCGVSHEARGWEHQRLITLITFYQKSTKSFDDMIFTNSSCKNFEKTSKINVSK